MKLDSTATGAITERQIDDLDRAIVARLRVDGRESNRSLARGLGISEATVATRLRHMEAEHMMRVVALTDIEALGYPFLAVVHLRVANRPVIDVGEDVAALAETIATSVTSGPFGVIAAVVARDGRHLADVLGKTLPRIHGIQDVRCEMALDVLRFESTWAVLREPIRSACPPRDGGALDQVDLAIVEAMQESGRSSYRRVASVLRLSEATIRARIARLQSERVVRFQAVCDAIAFAMTASAYVRIQVQDGRVDEVAAGLLACERVTVLMRTLGDFEFVAVVQARSREQLIDTILTEISEIAGVHRTDTSEIWRLLKHSYPMTRVL
jgi:DNA-binding Lrp family transcriptional regulator